MQNEGDVSRLSEWAHRTVNGDEIPSHFLQRRDPLSLPPGGRGLGWVVVVVLGAVVQTLWQSGLSLQVTGGVDSIPPLPCLQHSTRSIEMSIFFLTVSEMQEKQFTTSELEQRSSPAGPILHIRVVTPEGLDQRGLSESTLMGLLLYSTPCGSSQHASKPLGGSSESEHVV